MILKFLAFIALLILCPLSMIIPAIAISYFINNVYNDRGKRK